MKNQISGARHNGLSRRGALALAIGALALGALATGTPARACMMARSVRMPDMMVPTPSHLPPRLSLPSGSRIIFGSPHKASVTVRVTGNLQVLSKPGDALLMVGADINAGTQVATLAITQGGRTEITQVNIERHLAPPPPPLTVDLTDLERRSAGPFQMDGHTVLEVLVRADTPSVRLVFGEAGWKPVDTQFDATGKLFRGTYRLGGIDLNGARKPNGLPQADIAVLRGFEGAARSDTITVVVMPTPAC